MPMLVIDGPTFHSSGDEAVFFRWLRSIGCVRGVTGNFYELQIDVRRRRISNQDLHELIAILFRYRMPMNALAIFKSARNDFWFADPSMYWFEHVFGAKPKRKPKPVSA